VRSGRSWKDNNYLALTLGLTLALLVPIGSEMACRFLNRNRNSYSRAEILPTISATPLVGKGANELPVSFGDLQKNESVKIKSAQSEELPQLDDSDSTLKKTLRSDGYFLAPHLNGRAVMKIASSRKVVFDVEYSTDEYGRRYTPSKKNKKKPQKHFVLFGCSFGFGVGLNDSQTLTARLAEKAPEFNFYNNSIPGSSPSWLIRLLPEETLWKGIAEKKGIATYVYLDFHLGRALGTMSHVGAWGGSSPYVMENRSGQIEYLGKFFEAAPALTGLYNLLWGSEIVKYFELNFPIRFTDRHFEKFAKIIDEVRQAYFQRFPGSRFYVVGYPGSSSSTLRYLKPHFEKRAIQYLDYSEFNMQEYLQTSVKIEYDGHPSAEAIQLWSKILSRDLGLTKL